MSLASFVLHDAHETDLKAFMDIVTISDNVNNLKPDKFFFIFGEHARELISVESGFSFIRQLCRSTKYLHKIYRHKRNGVHKRRSIEIVIVVNANPLSRIRVERGDYCLRTNENGTDLNRNWNSNWEPSPNDGRSDYPGSRPFSEIETRIIRTALRNAKPHVFVTVHSGNCIYIRPDSIQGRGNYFLHKLDTILNSLHFVGPPCPFGALTSVLGYRSPGSSLDYAANSLDIPFVFGFEIYKGFLEMGTQNNGMLKPVPMKPHFPCPMPFERRNAHIVFRHENNRTDESEALQENGLDTSFFSSLDLRLEKCRIERANVCFHKFNPSPAQAYHLTLEMWNDVYAELLKIVELPM